MPNVVQLLADDGQQRAPITRSVSPRRRSTGTPLRAPSRGPRRAGRRRRPATSARTIVGASRSSVVERHDQLAFGDLDPARHRQRPHDVQRSRSGRSASRIASRRRRPRRSSSRGVPRRRIAAPEDRHPVAQAAGLVEVVGAEEDRPAGVAQVADAGSDVARRLRIEAARRLVQEHGGPARAAPPARSPASASSPSRSRPPDRRARSQSPSMSRQVAHALARASRSGRPCKRPWKSRLAAADRRSYRPGRLGQQADPRAHVVRPTGQVDAADPGRPSVGAIMPASIRTVVVLPAPFGPRKPKISPAPDLDRQVAHGPAVAEALA